MSVQEGLRQLGRQAVDAPFRFEEFEQRRALGVARRRTLAWGSTLSVAMLALVGLLALVTQPRVDVDSILAATQVPELSGLQAQTQGRDSPALVDMGRFDLTSELEDRIALLDAELSAARVQSAPAEQLRRIEGTRQQMSESLQRVSYAHALLNL